MIDRLKDWVGSWRNRDADESAVWSDAYGSRDAGWGGLRAPGTAATRARRVALVWLVGVLVALPMSCTALVIAGGANTRSHQARVDVGSVTAQLGGINRRLVLTACAERAVTSALQETFGDSIPYQMFPAEATEHVRGERHKYDVAVDWTPTDREWLRWSVIVAGNTSTQASTGCDTIFGPEIEMLAPPQDTPMPLPGDTIDATRINGLQTIVTEWASAYATCDTEQLRRLADSSEETPPCDPSDAWEIIVSEVRVEQAAVTSDNETHVVQLSIPMRRLEIDPVSDPESADQNIQPTGRELGRIVTQRVAYVRFRGDLWHFLGLAEPGSI